MWRRNIREAHRLYSGAKGKRITIFNRIVAKCHGPQGHQGRVVSWLNLVWFIASAINLSSAGMVEWVELHQPWLVSPGLTHLVQTGRVLTVRLGRRGHNHILTYSGMPGSHNDINVLDLCPLFQTLLHGKAPKCTLSINGNTYN